MMMLMILFQLLILCSIHKVHSFQVPTNSIPHTSIKNVPVSIHNHRSNLSRFHLLTLTIDVRNNNDWYKRKSELFSVTNNDESNNNAEIKASDGLDYVTISDSSTIYSSLRNRLSNIQRGIGKRYKCHTQIGFLNIHQEPTDPFDTNNIVGELHEGQVVTSIQPNYGDWICHDGGGWSISSYDGFVWLEPIEE